MILVRYPFADVSVDIIETPRIRFLLSDGMRFGAGIVLVPGVIADLGWIITKEPLGGTPCATGVFPLRLGGKPGFYIGDLTESNTELLGICLLYTSPSPRD